MGTWVRQADRRNCPEISANYCILITTALPCISTKCHMPGQVIYHALTPLMQYSTMFSLAFMLSGI